MNELDERFNYLNKNSTYQSSYDWGIYYEFHKVHNISISKKNGIELINTFVGCENCHVGFQVDTYLEGCTHDCKYCYAKIEGEAVGMWNNPVPKPLDFTYIWEALYKTFDINGSDHDLHDFLSRKVPLRLGSLSDPFLSLEKKLKVTKELIKILNHYDYPYLIVTRSNLISNEEYLALLRPDLASIHISIPSLDAVKTKVLEPRAPSPESRLQTIKDLRLNKIWVTARINPLFPVFKDGQLTSGKKLSEATVKDFNFYSDDLIKSISEAGCESILVGFVTLKSKIINQLSEDLEFPLRSLMKDEDSKGDFKFTTQEIRLYFEHVKNLSKDYGIQFTTCYLGQNTSQYHSNQDLWDNKKDCCNSVGVVEKHQVTSLVLPRYSIVTQQLKGKSFFQKIVLKMMSYILKNVERK
jgi:DNA repair photolyase